MMKQTQQTEKKYEQIIGQMFTAIDEIKTALQYRHTRTKYYADGLNLDQQVEFFQETIASLDALEELLPELTYEFEAVEEDRIQALEDEGMSRSDAQAVYDAEKMNATKKESKNGN